MKIRVRIGEPGLEFEARRALLAHLLRFARARGARALTISARAAISGQPGSLAIEACAEVVPEGEG